MGQRSVRIESDDPRTPVLESSKARALSPQRLREAYDDDIDFRGGIGFRSVCGKTLGPSATIGTLCESPLYREGGSYASSAQILCALLEP
ncbi:MAG: hypothetical protein ACJA1R_002979 [Flavobacteriales bacterium]